MQDQPTTDKDQILNTLAVHTGSLAKFGVKKIGLFGSYVRAEQTVHSDIDLLVDFDSEGETFGNLMGLCDFLESLFPQRKIEVLTINGLSRHVGPTILQEAEYVQIAT